MTLVGLKYLFFELLPGLYPTTIVVRDRRHRLELTVLGLRPSVLPSQFLLSLRRMALISLSLLALVAVLLVTWVVSRVIYRFFLHPLASFPGPKLAITTYCYEWYYDLIRRGQYTFKLKELHKQYGKFIQPRVLSIQ